MPSRTPAALYFRKFNVNKTTQPTHVTRRLSPTALQPTCPMATNPVVLTQRLRELLNAGNIDQGARDTYLAIAWQSCTHNPRPPIHSDADCSAKMHTAKQKQTETNAAKEAARSASQAQKKDENNDSGNRPSAPGVSETQGTRANICILQTHLPHRTDSLLQTSASSCPTSSPRTRTSISAIDEESQWIRTV